MTMPAVGDKAPDFDLPDGAGNHHRLADYLGKKTVVLYFYPRDDTPGCTREACAFRDLNAEFAARDAVILGVSPDKPASHQKFADKFSLNFPLLADPERQVIQAYGAWGEKTFMGRKSMGVLRSTFVIGKDGTIRAVFPNVKVDGHADKVLEAVSTL